MKHNKPGASNKPNTAKIILIILSIILALAAFCFAYLLLKEQRNNKDILAAYSEIDNSFGIGPSKITLTSAQGDFSRGGNLEAKGVDDNNNKINIYYHWAGAALEGLTAAWNSAPQRHQLKATSITTLSSMLLKRTGSTCFSRRTSAIAMMAH